MAYVKGDSVRFYKGTSVLDLEMEVKLMASMDTIETTVKGNNFKTFSNGDKSWSCDGKASIDFQKDFNIQALFSDFVAGSVAGISIGYNGVYYNGGGVLTSWSFDAVNNDLARFSFNIQGSSALTETSIISDGLPYVLPFTLP